MTLLPKGRAQLAKVISTGGDLISIAAVQKALQIDRTEAAKRLSRWAGQGWLHRVGPGTYAPVALDTLGAQQVLDDPWVLVPALFAPGYIGGRTAAEHWDLTEQIFNDIVVMTAQPLRQRRQQRHGTTFTLRHIGAEKVFGTKTVWRKHSRVLVSDVPRTIIDMLGEPDIGGGFQHVADCFTAYLAHPDRNDKQLIGYAARLGNGAVFKRLGFLAERSCQAASLAAACLEHLTAGIAKLDPSSTNRHFVARWRLHIPESWISSKADDRQA
jgi:predicted transcriptional regulator of viral defense system